MKNPTFNTINTLVREGNLMKETCFDPKKRELYT
jgi:hypothetical protein